MRLSRSILNLLVLSKMQLPGSIVPAFSQSETQCRWSDHRCNGQKFDISRVNNTIFDFIARSIEVSGATVWELGLEIPVPDSR